MRNHARRCRERFARPSSQTPHPPSSDRKCTLAWRCSSVPIGQTTLHRGRRTIRPQTCRRASPVSRLASPASPHTRPSHLCSSLQNINPSSKRVDNLDSLLAAESTADEASCLARGVPRQPGLRFKATRARMHQAQRSRLQARPRLAYAREHALGAAVTDRNPPLPLQQARKQHISAAHV